MNATRLFPTAAFGLLVVALAGSNTALAQKPTPKVKPDVSHPAPKPDVSHPAPKPQQASVKATEPKTPEIPESFKGIASKLNTTPAALETQFEAAHAANPKLTHGQFVAANVVAQNLGATHPGITAQAILDGLKSGKSIGKTLQGYELTKKQADDAEDAAKREIKAAEKAAKKAAKDAKEATKGTKKPDKDNPPKPPKKPDGR
jgi:hypothetical protein